MSKPASGAERTQEIPLSIVAVHQIPGPEAPAFRFIYGECQKCLRCGTTKDLARDHIVPLGIGGSDYANNLQPLCRSCNASKGQSYVDFRPEAYWRNWT